MPPSRVPLTEIVPLTAVCPVGLGQPPGGGGGGFGAGGGFGGGGGLPPVLSTIICHCWLAPSRSWNWEIIAPSAVDQPHTSRALLLCRLMNRTYPPLESASRKCWRVLPLAAAFCTSWTPSLALGSSRTLPLCTERTW